VGDGLGPDDQVSGDQLQQEEGTAAVKQDAEANIRREKKKRSGIFKVCKKLLHL
jgi:hypothetical protein